MLLTECTSDVLGLLTGPIRVLSDIQVARTWCAETRSPVRNARRLLRRMDAAGFLDLYRALVHPELTLDAPVLSWAEGGPVPDFAHAAHLLKRRWAMAPVLTTCVCATARARSLFGGLGRRPREVELTHDLHLSALFLRLRERDPVAAAHWCSEEQIRRERVHLDERVPDAIVRIPGTPPRVVEFGGAYKKQKLEAFHDYCELESLAYEIW